MGEHLDYSGGYESLAAAIVRQCINDYRWGLLTWPSAKGFLCSRWGQFLLQGIPCELVIDRLREERR